MDDKTNRRVVEEESGLLQLRVQHGDHKPVKTTFDVSDALWPEKTEQRIRNRQERTQTLL